MVQQRSRAIGLMLMVFVVPFAIAVPMQCTGCKCQPILGGWV